MTNLLWPGDHRAGEAMTDRQVLGAMVRVERAWLAVLADCGIAPADAATVPAAAWVTGEDDVEELARAAEAAGNPAVPLVPLLRERLPEPAATWVHRGLTSQDVMDTALILCAKDAVEAVESLLAQQVSALVSLMTQHRSTRMLTRTLTQPALGSTFGVRVAGWLTGVLDAADTLAAVAAALPVQVGGAAGTMAAVAELAHGRGLPDPAAVAARAADLLADKVGLRRALPWHTSRRPVTALGDALVTCTDTWGHIARDVLESARAEVAELGEPAAAGRGGSSTMPGKRKPVLSVLIRRAAIAAPPLAASLHQAAAAANEERSDGAWHAEWDTVRLLGRRTVTAGSHAAELLAGLEVDTAAMARNLGAHLERSGGLDPEQRAMAALSGAAPAAGYLGMGETIIDRVAARARQHLSGRPRHHSDMEESSR
jgi:3-carboxy-cis,cis-muconate cycloisomerase